MAAQALEDEKYQLVLQLTNPDTREGALLELSKRRESFGDLAPILWHSFGTMAALLSPKGSKKSTPGMHRYRYARVMHVPCTAISTRRRQGCVW